MAKTKKTAETDIQQDSGLNITQYASDTKDELAKVVWPSRQQVISESAAVVLMVILVATIVYVVDNLFAWVSGQVF